MDVKPVDSLGFGYSNILKTLYKKGKLPTVKYGFYGDEITEKTVTLEHLKPKCFGGKTELSNLVLTSANKNQERGVRPLSEMFNWEFAGKYFEQFRNLVVDNFNGNEYIVMAMKTIKELLENDSMV